ncbi:DNA translocase FtsK [Methylobacterium sp. Leaf466]|uniref:DNA translocase FtsK n=1 Tax=Methylobacterium sp. Leaf466 TaxID=1736386 RepID=UPI0007001F6F|nr:DNA translocase FtsK [Methylobacterium sp. Leaf466]KQT77777.1 cell division protein FtsK [Methylobacterium sp. Leaf466]
MRASGRPPYSHRDPSRPGRGGDRPGLSLGALAHRLLSLRASLARRLTGPAQRPGFSVAATRPAQTWLASPASLLGRDSLADGPTAQTWPDHVFDDRATPDMLRAATRSGESRIDEDASGPRVLIRTPRRPAAIMPEAGTAAAAPQPFGAEAEEVVRYTRTPDPVLQERRQRVRDAERAAQEQADALAAARREAEAAEALALEQAQAAHAAALPPAAPLPLWRQPFVVPPGVRFFRSPDRKPAAVVAVVAPPAPEPAEAIAADWSDVPDWSDMGTWFDGQDGAAIEAWSDIQDPSAQVVILPEVVFLPEVVIIPEVVVPEPSAPDVALPSSVEPAAPAYGIDRLVRFAPSAVPSPADGQDNAAGVRQRPAALSAMAARAAIRPAAAKPQADAPTVDRVPEAPSPAASSVPGQVAEPLLRSAEPIAAVIPFLIPALAPATLAEAPAFVPVAMAPRPVLLRNPKAAAVEVVEETPAAVAEPAVQAPASGVPASEVPASEGPASEVPAAAAPPEPAPAVHAPRAILPDPRATLIPAGRHVPMSVVENADYELPSLELLAEPDPTGTEEVDADVLEQNALNLQQTVQDFGVRGDILAVRPGPVVTLYELEPAPGTKSSRVIGLSDDIARSMSAVSARVAVVPGRNVIGIELPNDKRETVYLRELLASADFGMSKHKLALCLGKNIGGEPIIADLAKMPHLLVAGTTGSGKSVAINTMILSLLYRMKPEECRLIMVDPKMLELSVYDGIPHLLSPVVIDPKKAVIALKWAVREMEERYKKMSKIAVRNIDGYNARMAEARARGEVITREIHTGFNRETGQPVFETEEMDLSALPYIVIVVDEMADLMMVAGKDIEGAIQRLAQMARAAGIHLIMATQRPSVDVITGTIKANFPTRISFQVTSKIDSRTILGEMGAEQLLGQGDMLFMAGGGRTTRVHGPFCSDSEVESVVAHLKRQGRPSYLDAVTADDGSGDEKPAKGSKADKAAAAETEEADAPIFDAGAYAGGGIDAGADLYDQAVQVVMRDRKASTSYIQRRLQIGYNRAASLMERMEVEGIVGPANHAGKREILMEGAPPGMMHGHMMDDDD